MSTSISVHVPHDLKLFSASDDLLQANSKCTSNDASFAVKVAPDSNATSEVQRSETDQAVMTIESLRARLLYERAASRAAREEVRKNAKRVLQLQSQLLLEIKERKKTEAAAEEAVTKLRLKELDTASSSGSGQELNSNCTECLKESVSGSESEKLCQVSSDIMEEDVKICTVSFKYHEKQNAACKEMRGTAKDALSQNQNTLSSEGINSGFELEQLSEDNSSNLIQDVKSSNVYAESDEKDVMTYQIIPIRDKSNMLQGKVTFGGPEIINDDSFEFNKDGKVTFSGPEIINDDSFEINKDELCLISSDDLKRCINAEVSFKENGDKLEEEIESNEVHASKEESAKALSLQINNQYGGIRLKASAIKEQLQGVWSQLEEEIATLSEDPNKVHYVRLKLRDTLNNVTSLLEENLQEEQNSNILSMRSANSYMNQIEGERMSQTIEVESSIHKNIYKGGSPTTKKTFDITSEPVSSSETCSGLDRALHQQGKPAESIIMSPPSDFTYLKSREALQSLYPSKLQITHSQLNETGYPSLGPEAHVVRERANSGFDFHPDENIIKGTCLDDPVALFREVQDAVHFESGPKMGELCLLNSRHKKVSSDGVLSDETRSEDGQHGEIVSTGGIKTYLFEAHPPVVEELPNCINKSAKSVGSFHPHDSLSKSFVVKREIDVKVHDKVIPGREMSFPSKLTSLPYRNKKLSLKPDNRNGLFYCSEGEYQFSSEISRKETGHISMTGPSKNISIAQTSKAVAGSRLEGILAALHLVKQQIRNSTDPWCSDSNGGISMNGCSGGAYFVTSPSRMDSPVASFALEGRPFSHADLKFPPHLADCSPQAIDMQMPNSTAIGISKMRSKSISETFSMPSFETYHRPRRKVHLGNGISLYID